MLLSIPCNNVSHFCEHDRKCNYEIIFKTLIQKEILYNILIFDKNVYKVINLSMCDYLMDTL